jgi:adenosylhomocysteine nucleosidase
VTTPTPHLGILAGLRSEARCVLPHLPPDEELLASVALSGARRPGAEAACGKLIAAGATHLLSFGLAGGLDPALPPGTLLVPDRLSLSDGTGYRADAAWHARLVELFHDQRPKVGCHFGADLAIASAAEKQALFAGTAALGVDMESHLLARAAAEAGLPFAMIRVICDAADDALPPAALKGVKPDGSTDILAVLGSLLRQPGQIPALRRLARAAAAAERVLALCGARVALIGIGLR